MNEVTEFNKKIRSSKEVPELRPGYVVKLYRKIKEGNKERIQVFEGIIISIKGKQSSSPMITVRKESFGVGVEMILPIYSPTISKIEVVKKLKVRRAKLYFLRKGKYKASKLKVKTSNLLHDEEKAKARKGDDHSVKQGDKQNEQKSEI